MNGSDRFVRKPSRFLRWAQKRRRKASRPKPVSRNADFRMEPLEPRLLLSADINVAEADAIKSGWDGLAVWGEALEDQQDFDKLLGLVNRKIGDTAVDIDGDGDIDANDSTMVAGVLDQIRDEVHQYFIDDVTPTTGELATRLGNLGSWISVTDQSQDSTSVGIAADADDGTENALAGTWASGNASNNWGAVSGHKEHTGLVFTLDVEQGHTVDSAILTLNVGETGTFAGGKIYADTGLTQSSFSGADLPSAISKTTAFATVDNTVNAGTINVDLTSVIQEIVDLGGWNSGDKIRLLLEADSATGSNHLTIDDSSGAGSAPSLSVDSHDTLSFQVDISHTGANDFDITGIEADLGVDADRLSMDISGPKPTVDLGLGLDFDFDFTIDDGAGSPDDRFFLEETAGDADGLNLHATADVNESGVNFDLDVGVLGTTVSGATLVLDGDIDSSFSAGLLADGKVTLGELGSSHQNGDVVTAATGVLDIDLPVTAKAGLSGAPAPETITIGDHIGLFDLDVAEEQDPDRVAPPVKMSETLASFTTLTSGDILSPIVRFAEFLDDLGDSWPFQDLLPFVDNVKLSGLLGSSDSLAVGTSPEIPFGWGGALRDKVSDHFQTGGQADFQTIQEMAEEVLPGANVTASYDGSTEELTFDVAVSDFFQDDGAAPDDFLDQPFDLNLELDPQLTDLDLTGTVHLSSEVGMDFTYGVDLTPTDDAVIEASEDNLLLQDGILDGDATFDLVIKNTGQDNIDQTVSVMVSSDAANTSVQDLLADVQGALSAALTNAGLASDRVTVDLSTENGFRLDFFGKEPGDQLRTFVDDSYDASPDPALTQLGLDNPSVEILGATQPVASGILGTSATFDVTVDSSTYNVTVTSLSTQGNEGVDLEDGRDDLIDDINDALAAAGVPDGLVVASFLRTDADNNEVKKIRFVSDRDFSISNLGGSAASGLGLANDSASPDLSPGPRFTALGSVHTTPTGKVPGDQLTFRLAIGTDAPVTVVVGALGDGGDPSNNNSIDDLRADIQAALDAKGLDVEASVVTPAGGGEPNQIALNLKDTSSNTFLRILEDPADPGLATLGFDNGQFGLADEHESFFVEDDADIRAEIGMDLDEDSAQGRFGFFDLDLGPGAENVALAASLDISLGLNDPDADGKILLDDPDAAKSLAVRNAIVAGDAAPSDTFRLDSDGSLELQVDGADLPVVTVKSATNASLRGGGVVDAGGDLAGDATFDLTFDGATFSVTVLDAHTLNNSSASDIIPDVTAAIAVAVQQFNAANTTDLPTDLIRARMSGDHLEFFSEYAPRQIGIGGANASAQNDLGLTGNVYQVAGATPLAGKDPGGNDFSISTDTAFQLTVDGTVYEVDLFESSTIGNNTREMLRQDIQDAVDAEGAPVSVILGSDNLVRFVADNSGELVSLSIADPTDLDALDVLQVELGLDTAFGPGDLADEVNRGLEEAGIEGIRATTSEDAGSGELRISLEYFSIHETLGVKTSFADLGFTAPQTSDEPLIGQPAIGGGLGAGDPGLDPGIASIVSGDVRDLQLVMDLPGELLGEGVGFDIVVKMTDLRDFESAEFSFTSDIGETMARNLDFSDVMVGLDGAADFLLKIQEDLDLWQNDTAGSLEGDIPLLGVNPTEVNDFLLGYQTLIDNLTVSPPPSLQVLEARIEEALDLDVLTSDLFGFSGERLDINLDFGNDQTKSVPFNIDIYSLAEREAGGVPSELDVEDASIFSLDPTVRHDIVSEADIDLDLQLDYSGGEDPETKMINTSSVELNVGVDADNLVFEARYGAAPIIIDGGSVTVEGLTDDFATYTVNLDANGKLEDIVDEAIDLDTLVTSDLEGKASATLPIEDALLNPVGTLEIRIADIEAAMGSLPGAAGTVDFLDPIPDLTVFPENQQDGNRISRLLRDPQLFIDGIDRIFGNIQTLVEFALEPLELPLIGAGILDNDTFDDFFATLDEARADFRQTLTVAFRALGGDNDQGFVDAIQQSLFDAFGPGGLDILQDAADIDLAVDIDDVFVTTGVAPDEFVQWDFHIGQSIVFNLPFEFGLGLQDIPGLGESLPGFGFNIDSGDGVDLEFRWDIRAGLGVGIDDGFYLNSEVNETPGDPTSDVVPEMLATMIAELPGQAAQDPFEIKWAMGLMQLEGMSGTDTAASITAKTGRTVPGNPTSQPIFSLLGDKTYDFDFDLVMDGVTHAVDYTTVGTETFLEFILNINQTTLVPIGVLASFDFSDPLAPALTFTAMDADVESMTIVDGVEEGFLANQHEDQRSVGLGFSNGQSGLTITAQRDAPTDGLIVEDTDMIFRYGANEYDLDMRALLHDDVDSLAALADALKDAIAKAIGQVGKVDVVLVGDKLQLVSTDGSTTMEIVSVQDKETTNLVVSLGVDMDDGDNGRLTLQELAAEGVFGVFSPTLEADAQLRFDVSANTDHITDFAEDLFGTDGLGLPSLEFDLKIDVGIPAAFAAAKTAAKGKVPTPISNFEFDNVTLQLGELLGTVVKPIATALSEILGPFTELLGDGTDALEGFIAGDLPILDDLGFDISILDIMNTLGIDGGFRAFINALRTIESMQQIVEQVGEDAEFNFGCWEVVMDPTSPLFIGKTKVPVPCAVTDALSSLGLPAGLVAEFEADIEPGGFRLDILSPNSVINMILGEPFDIVSFNMPTIDIGANFELPFHVGIGDYGIGFDIGIYANLHADLGIVYDSTGLARIMSAINAGATPDYLDLFDGFYVRNEPGDELSLSFGFHGGAQVGPIEVDLLLETVTLFEAHASINADLHAGLDLLDPNEDGALRIDEFVAFMGDPINIANILCLFDAHLSFSGGFDIGGTLLGISIGTDDLPFDTDINFSVSTADFFGSLGVCQVPQPVLAEVVEETVFDEFGNATSTESVVRLNTGPFDHARLIGDTDDSDGPVHYVVTGSKAAGLNFTAVNAGPNSPTGSMSIGAGELGDVVRIVGFGSDFNDTFDLSGVTDIPVVIDGRSGNDIIMGGGAADSLTGGLGNDNLQGNGGADDLYGDTGRDTLQGGGGVDLLQGGTDNDSLVGGGGSDIYEFLRNWGDDVISEGAADGTQDRIDFSGRGRQVVPDPPAASPDPLVPSVRQNLFITLDYNGIEVSDLTNTVTVQNSGSDQLDHQVEQIIGGKGDDYYSISATNTTNQMLLDGFDGGDTYHFFMQDPIQPDRDDLFGDIRLKDTGEPFSVDRLLFDGSDENDIVGLSDLEITFRRESAPPPPNSIQYGTSGAESGVEVIEIRLFDGEDTAGVESTPAEASVLIAGMNDNDLITFGISLSPDLEDEIRTNLDDMAGSEFNGPIIVDGGLGQDRLRVWDTTDTDDNDGLLTNAIIRGLDMEQGIDYEEIEFLDFELGGGSDTFNIQSVRAETTLRAFGGNDTINISDDLELGDAAPDGTGLVDSIVGGVTVWGGDGDDTMNVSDAGDDTDNLGTLTQTTLTGLGMAVGITYFEFDDETLNIDLGSGADRFNTRGTIAVTSLDAASGDDLIYVSTGADLALLETFAAGADLDALHDAILHGTLDDVDGQLNIEAGAGDNTLSVSDRQSAAADTGVVITETMISGLATGLINYAATGGTFAGQGFWPRTGDFGLFGRGVNIYAGSGGNNIDIQGTHKSTAPRTITSLFSGEGSDTVTASVGSGDDFLVVRGQAGNDDIDASSSSIDLALFGDAGSDTVDGGSAADILFGDGGRAYFLNPNGGNPPAGAPFDVVLGGARDQAHLTGFTFDSDALTADLVLSVDAATDGDDEMGGGQGLDILIGGDGADDMDAGEGDNIGIGDYARIELSGGIVESVESLLPAEGGDDTMASGTGRDILIGGQGRDDISSTGGDNAVLGDNGRYILQAGVPQLLESTAPGTGGDDDITLGDGADRVIAGVGGDTVGGGNGENVVLGDNGRIDFALDFITTTDPTDGGNDVITTGSGADILLGGTAMDTVTAGAGADIVFGDHGQVDGQLPPEISFTAIDTQAADLGDSDLIHGNEGDDTILGQQGDDRLFGDEDDDDLFGGHNVAGGIDELTPGDGRNDTMDGGAGDDWLAGDNAAIIRRSDTLNPRFRVLAGETLYDADLDVEVTGDAQADPAGAPGRDITLFDHSDAPAPGTFGSDSMAGGAADDALFGQLGNDVIQGDGSVGLDALATLESAADRINDGDDYVEGNGGDDLIFGNLGQDDLIGGSSELFSLTTPDLRPDGSDLIFGGAGTDIDRNTAGDEATDGHAQDADAIAGDNANIFRIVGTNGTAGGGFVSFNYDDYDPTAQIVVRGVDLLDYTPGTGDAADIGAGDEIHGEAGDDAAYGAVGDDLLFGEGQDDDLYGGAGRDWLAGGAGEDGMLGDDGRIFSSRNGTAEPLYGIEATTEERVSQKGASKLSNVMNPDGELKKSVDLEPFVEGDSDTMYGGLGDDSLHGGAGNDLLSGAEALAGFYANPPTTPEHPYDYDPVVNDFTDFDDFDPLAKIEGHALNFEATDGSGNKIHDGNDVLFGDDGEDWLVGGTDSDHMYGGLGNDILNADDNLETDTEDKGQWDDADTAFGGAGRDTLLASGRSDRLVDWVGEFNAYVVPFNPFGAPTISRGASPHTVAFLLQMGESDGADQTRQEPYGELGLVTQKDDLWGDQTGGPDDPQPGNKGGTKGNSGNGKP